MSAGVAAHPVGELVDAGTKTSRIICARVSTQSDGREAMVPWDSHLVDLCRKTGLEFRSLCANIVQLGVDNRLSHTFRCDLFEKNISTSFV